MKASLMSLVYGGENYMTDKNKEHVHPDVEVISIPFIQFNPVYYALVLMMYVFPPFGYLGAVSLLFGRFGWFYAHQWNIFWWSILFGFFFNFFWVWILDAWGWIEADWFW